MLDLTKCAVCYRPRTGHDETQDHKWLDPDEHAEAHRPPNDDTVNCLACQAEAEAQWEGRFER